MIELIPTNQKSFYGKCKLYTTDNIDTLVSYSTEVASYDHSNKHLQINGWYSSTTARHINAFLNHIGQNQMNKKEMNQGFYS